MRASACALVLLVACRAAPVPTPPSTRAAPVQHADIPLHTQAMIDAYRDVQALHAQPAPSCPGALPAPAQHQRYLEAIGGCTEPATPQVADAEPPEQLLSAELGDDGVDRCVVEALRLWPDLTGRQVHRLHMTADGHVSSVTTREDDQPQTPIGCCVRRELRKLRTPPRKGPFALEHVVPLDVAGTSRNGKNPRFGTLPREALTLTEQRHAHDVRACYQSAAAKQARVGEGPVQVRFVIAEDGSVPAAVVQLDPLRSPDVACCVAREIERWRFPQPRKNGIVVVDHTVHYRR